VSLWVLVSPLFGGIVSGLLVFVLTTRRDKQFAAHREDQERKGLCRLIDMEIYQNKYKLLMIKNSPDLGQLYDSYSRLHAETWYESKVRLVQLLSSDHIEVLVKYYGLIQRLGVSLHDEPFKPTQPLTRKDKRNPKVRQALTKAETDSSEKKNVLLSVYAREALKYGDDARQRGEQYIGEVSDYFELYEEESTADN
jgi:hypothetical protein